MNLSAAPSPCAEPDTTRRQAATTLSVQHLLSSRRDELVMQILFDRVGEQLATRFNLCRGIGDLVLIDGGPRQKLSPEVLHAFKEGRPAVTLDLSQLADARCQPMRDQVANLQQGLMQQLSAIVRVHQRLADEAPVSSGFDSQFDSRIDAEPMPDNLLLRSQCLVLARARAGSADPSRPALLAGYEPGQNMRLDFAAGIASIDPEAELLLRNGRCVPHPRPGEQPGRLHRTRALDRTLWDLGVAGAALPLLDEPADWWHTPVARRITTPIGHLTQHPCYRELERLLARGPVTPSALRRQARASVPDLRAFLQATLLLNLVAWQLPRG